MSAGRVGLDEDLQGLARLALAFGQVRRATYHPDGVTSETDTDHTVMLALIVLEAPAWFPELSLRPDVLLSMALVHDLVEVEAGDVNTVGGLSQGARQEKELREERALAALKLAFPRSTFCGLIQQYNRQDCVESRFVRYIDKILPKLTHALNGAAAIRAMGKDVAWLRERHDRQAAELMVAYPDLAPFLDPLFQAAARASEHALRFAGAGPAWLGDDGEQAVLDVQKSGGGE